MTETVRAPFRSILPLNLRTGVLLLVLFGLVRITLVLQANVTGSYQVVSLVFVAMIALPWILLTRDGRGRVGLVRPSRWRWVLPAVSAGVAHESFAAGLGDRRAALIDAAAFAVTHLAHFGLVFVAVAWAFLPLPALFWVVAMFLASLAFYGFRKLTGSLLGAVAAHAGFNLAMNWVIFYMIIPLG